MSRICLLPFTTFPTYPHPHPGPTHQLLLPGNIAAPLVTLHPLSPQSVLSRASRVIFLKSKSEPVPLLLKNRVGTHLTQRKGSFKDPRASDQCSALPSHFSPPLTLSTPVTVVQAGQHVSASGPLHLLLPLPGTIFSQIPTVLSHSFC